MVDPHLHVLLKFLLRRVPAAVAVIVGIVLRDTIE